MAMEMSTDSSSCSHQPHLPPGFRFHPTDEELVVHYLRRKAAAAPLPVSIIAEIDLYKHDPWELPAKASFGEHEWYFFSPRDRKYPNGARPNRAATSGYWKATGTDKPIRGAGGGRVLGVKKALVFYGGKPPRGVKTNWIMHEYRLAEGGGGGGGGCKGGVEGRGKKVSLRLDDWVLCRIYQKHSTNRQAEQDILQAATTAASVAAAHIPQYPSASPATLLPLMTNTSELCKRPAGYGAMLAHEEIFYEGLLASASATGPFAVKPPELSLILPDGLVPVPPYCQGKAADGEGGDENCGQIGGYFHYPVLGTYHHLNWSA